MTPEFYTYTLCVFMLIISNIKLTSCRGSVYAAAISAWILKIKHDSVGISHQSRQNLRHVRRALRALCFSLYKKL